MIKKNNLSLICVIVKTPGFSPIKTRLELPPAIAEKLFYQSCMATYDELNKLCLKSKNVHSTWHIAEPFEETKAFWPLSQNHFSFHSFQRGEGFGDILDQAYRVFRKEYQNVFFIGGDSPALMENDFQFALQQIESHDFYLGPALDGGFTIFGGRRDIPKEVWNKIAYSRSNTCDSLASELARIGDLSIGPINQDFDRREDLETMTTRLMREKTLNKYQLQFIELSNRHQTTFQQVR